MITKWCLLIRDMGMKALALCFVQAGPNMYHFETSIYRFWGCTLQSDFAPQNNIQDRDCFLFRLGEARALYFIWAKSEQEVSTLIPQSQPHTANKRLFYAMTCPACHIIPSQSPVLALKRTLRQPVADYRSRSYKFSYIVSCFH